MPSTILVCKKNLGSNLNALETMQPAVRNPNFREFDENWWKIYPLKYCLRQKLGLRQLNYVLFATKQVLTTKQSKIAEKSTSMKVTGFAIMPYVVKSVGTVIFFHTSLQPVIVFDVYSFSGSFHWWILIQ